MLIFTYYVIVVAFFTCLFSLICAISLALLDKRAKRILRLEAGTTGMPTLTLTTHHFYPQGYSSMLSFGASTPQSPDRKPQAQKSQPKTPKPQPQQMRNNKDKKESKSREKNFIICALSIIQSSSCALNQFT